jgi:hypothetical protein
MGFKTIVIIIICSFSLMSSICHANAFNESKTSFFQLVGRTDWALNLKSFVVSTAKEGTVFRLRVGDGRCLGFSAHQGEDTDSGRFGPLQEKHTARLSELITYALSFSEQDKEGDFSMHMTWEMYPESIRKWARVWQHSILRKNWDNMDRHTRYQKLTKLISKFIKNEMQAVAGALGFEATGASMEKMQYQKAHQLTFYNNVLKPAGIHEDLKIPIPMMLSVLLKPLEKVSIAEPREPVSVGPFSVDYIFVVAKRDTVSLYCSFNRALDEYEITGDMVHSDGTYKRILPMSRKAYQSISTRLLNACLATTGGDKRETLSFRINLALYPDVYREVVKLFTRMPDDSLKSMIDRPQLPHLNFYSYDPSAGTGFRAAIKPFWDLNGYEFLNFQIHIGSKRKAKEYPEYETLFQPLGIKPDDKPAVPDIVYMVLKKK